MAIITRQTFRVLCFRPVLPLDQPGTRLSRSRVSLLQISWDTIRAPAPTLPGEPDFSGDPMLFGLSVGATVLTVNQITTVVEDWDNLAFDISPVPEPSGLLLLASALAGIGMVHRKGLLERASGCHLEMSLGAGGAEPRRSATPDRRPQRGRAEIIPPTADRERQARVRSRRAAPANDSLASSTHRRGNFLVIVVVDVAGPSMQSPGAGPSTRRAGGARLRR